MLRCLTSPALRSIPTLIAASNLCRRLCGSRSWKSGFLRRRPSSIQLVDGTHTLNLKTYVGQRVEATGMLLNREMRARSLQPVAASCN